MEYGNALLRVSVKQKCFHSTPVGFDQHNDGGVNDSGMLCRDRQSTGELL